MFEPTVLSAVQRQQCLDTVSPNTFYMLVVDALLRKEPLSVVRAGDGEKSLMDMCEGLPMEESSRDINDDDWMGRLGCLGIDKQLLYKRMCMAAEECTYFAPSISGIIRSDFSLYGRFKYRTRYVDNFWCNAWDEEMKVNLYKAAKHVLFIHRNQESFDALQIRAGKIGVKTSYLKLDNWREAESIIERAAEIDAPLVLFSAGPASKYIGARISTGGRIPKVSLDLGNASDFFLLHASQQNSIKEQDNGK
jgi:hypothetical protein